ncbi:MAG: hypothetical protein BWY85_02369 [Firmicutes bacterium ADurb.Bin506]|nr:MAG: hypothetical protein BWY85_02369 [Firmicutes bacterium ADurb.Bin506]
MSYDEPRLTLAGPSVDTSEADTTLESVIVSNLNGDSPATIDPVYRTSRLSRSAGVSLAPAEKVAPARPADA